MSISRRTVLGSAAAAAVLSARRTRAQTSKIRIGVLNDQSGPYRNTGGPTSVACVRQAVQEFGSRGFDVDVIAASRDSGTTAKASI
jgi:branched-chain amino acid transport system substrate-binding protein